MKRESLMREGRMNYGEWEKDVPSEIRQDSLWRMEAYRLGLFIADVGWRDATKLMSDRRTLRLSDQLYRALGSISANLAEGYSRGTGKDRARFYEYALGSARESRDWYFKARHVLGESVTEHRVEFLTQIIRLLLKMVPQQRGSNLRESQHTYETSPDERDLTVDVWRWDDLFEDVPLP